MVGLCMHTEMMVSVCMHTYLQNLIKSKLQYNPLPHNWSRDRGWEQRPQNDSFCVV